MAIKRKNNNLFNLEDSEKEEEIDEMTIAATKKGGQKNKVYFEFNPYDTELKNALFDKTLENYKKNRENQENRIKIVNYYEIFKNEYDKDIGILDEKNRVKNKVKELIPMVISEIKQY
jgi:hypothetical protein